MLSFSLFVLSEIYGKFFVILFWLCIFLVVLVVVMLLLQVQVFGNHRTPEMWREEIMKVSSEDVVRVAKRILSSKPTLLSMGPDISRVPNVDEVADAIKQSTA